MRSVAVSYLFMVSVCSLDATQLSSELPAKAQRILVIGSTGAGKSTLINALLGSDVMATSSDARGCTASYAVESVEHKGITYEFVDTVGLNEPEGGTVGKTDALLMFFQFLRDNHQGFNLIIFCMREERMTEQTKATYQVMVKDLYSQAENEAPPVLLFVGGIFLSYATPQEWCDQNRDTFLLQGFVEARQAQDGLHCISLPPVSPNPMMEAAFEGVRKQSTARAWALIEKHSVPEALPFFDGFQNMMKLGYYMWNRLVDLADRIPSLDGTTLKHHLGLVKAVPSQLWDKVKHLGFSKEEAANVMDSMEDWI